MQYDLVLVPESQKPSFWQLFQGYLAELGAFTGKPPINGEYDYRHFDNYWQEPNDRWPYYLKDEEGTVCSLAMVRRYEDTVYEVAEFYVLPKWRGKGLGRCMLEKIMKRHQGSWRLEVLENHMEAQKFWSKVFGNHPACQVRQVVINNLPRIEFSIKAP